jgi:hypothetical protein
VFRHPTFKAPFFFPDFLRKDFLGSGVELFIFGAVFLLAVSKERV